MRNYSRRTVLALLVLGPMLADPRLAMGFGEGRKMKDFAKIFELDPDSLIATACRSNASN